MLSISTTQVSEPPMKQAIRDLVKVMRLDHGKFFTSQFDNDQNTVDKWQHRLFSKVHDLHPNDLITAYERFSEERPGHLPNILELVSGTINAKKIRVKAEKEQAEVMRITALPPAIEPKADKERIFSLMRDSLSGIGEKETAQEKEARLARLEQKQADHQRLLLVEGFLKGRADDAHKCAVGYCTFPGVLSASAGGGGNFYCKEHFRKE